MKIFLQRELREAYAHADAGGQALHICDSRAFVLSTAPTCFRKTMQFAHLFDQDYDRMMRTARELGVRVVKPEHPGTHRQHVDLCGKPLQRAIDLAAELEQLGKQSMLELSLEAAMEATR